MEGGREAFGRAMPALAPTLPAAPTVAPAPAVASGDTRPTPGTAAAPLEAGYYSTAVSEADDADLAFARMAGIPEIELGIGAVTTPPAAAPGAGSQESGAGGTPAAAPVVATPPAAETQEARVARLRAELAAAEAGQPVQTPAPPAPGSPEGRPPLSAPAPSVLPPLGGPMPGQPLAAVTGEQNFAFLAETAKRVKSWAFAHRDGGEMPADLASLLERSEALITGRQAAEVRDPRYFDAERTAHLHELSEAMLTEHLPAREQMVQAESRFLGQVTSETPEMLDVSKPEGQLFYRIVRAYPALRQYRDWPLLVRHIARDYKANATPAPAAAAVATPPATVAAAAAATPAAAAQVPAIGGGTVPLAPAGSIGGLSVGGAPVSQTRLDEAEARLNAGTFTEADLLLLSAAAC